MADSAGSSEIETIIPPEIVDDALHRLIDTLARTENLKHVLEIGSSAGAGSTKAFVTALRRNPSRPTFYCLEVSKPRFEALAKTYARDAFVRPFNMSSVRIDEFPSEAEVAAFYSATPTTLNQYPVERVLGWMQQDIAYIREAGAPQGGIEHIKRDAGIDTFDMVLIDGSEFTGDVELDHVYGSGIILLDDTNAYKCHAARARLLTDPDYELIADDQSLRNGYSAFRRKAAAVKLPVHFFTIVLNGEPFIRYHLQAFEKLDFPWHWHIVEGVAALKHDTAWSVAGGGRIEDSLHQNGRSKDGTSDFLDEIAAARPEQITLYRKPPGEFWDGKKEMVSAPLENLPDDCLLWQVDADELWTNEQIATMRAQFLKEPERTAAMFWCHYFVGPHAVISTRYNYAQNPDQEWRRVWRFRSGDSWAAHEPPTLVRKVENKEVDVASIAPFLHEETEALDLVFQHFAYVTPEQARFKETYYGYTDAERHWRRLQEDIARKGAVLLRDYFPWVTDNTIADASTQRGPKPLLELDRAPASTETATPFPIIVVDAAFFQHNQKSGIARVWRALLKEWRESGFREHVVVLDRAGTAPRIPGLRYRSAPAWDPMRTGDDSRRLQRICDEEGADVFISSYYTSPIRTPSVFLAHDFIPEKFAALESLDDPNWIEKRMAIEHASHVICVSEQTRRDFLTHYPQHAKKPGTVILNAVEDTFRPAAPEEVTAFRLKHGVARPYLLLVGDRTGFRGYKNGLWLFRALNAWPARRDYDVMCVGGGPLEPELGALARGVTVHNLDLTDAELRCAYTGAHAYVCPSRFEGFGLPLLEAMACACPVIAMRASCLPEIGGDAALYFDEGDVQALCHALDRLAIPEERTKLMALGSAHAATFRWRDAASAYAQALRETAAAVRDGVLPEPSPVWELLRNEQRRIQQRLARGGAAVVSSGPVSVQGPMRSLLFSVRGFLLRTLPAPAIPAARRVWRMLIGVRA